MSCAPSLKSKYFFLGRYLKSLNACYYVSLHLLSIFAYFLHLGGGGRLLIRLESFGGAHVKSYRSFNLLHVLLSIVILFPLFYYNANIVVVDNKLIVIDSEIFMTFIYSKD